MKTINYISVIILLFLLSTNKVSAQTEEPLLIGTWQFNYEKSIHSILSDSKNFYEKQSENKREHIERIYNQRKLIFLSDGQFILELGPNTRRTGTWELLRDKLEVQIKMDSGKNLRQRIIEINDLELCLDLDKSQNKGQKRLFDRWYLNKVNN